MYLFLILIFQFSNIFGLIVVHVNSAFVTKVFCRLLLCCLWHQEHLQNEPGHRVSHAFMSLVCLFRLVIFFFASARSTTTKQCEIESQQLGEDSIEALLLQEVRNLRLFTSSSCVYFRNSFTNCPFLNRSSLLIQQSK